MSEFRPYPKSQSLKGGNEENTYPCSDGSRITQDELNRKIKQAKARKGKKERCSAFGDDYNLDEHGVLDWSHTLSVQRCKELGKAELAYDPKNMVCESRIAHINWENLKGGEWVFAKNVKERMDYLAAYDSEMYFKRLDIMHEGISSM